MKKRICLMLTSIACAAVTLAGCWFQPPQSDGVFPYDWAQSEGYRGSEGEWLSSLETPQTLYLRLYEEAKAQGYAKSYVEFLRDMGAENAVLVQSAVRSAVRIEAYFAGMTTGSGGAGVVYSYDEGSGDLLVITNYHVLYDVHAPSPFASSIALWLYGNEGESGKISAKYLCGAMQYDIAVLSVSGEDVVTTENGTHTNAEAVEASAVCAAVWGDPEGLSVSDPVYAIGNPLGLGLSVTAGVLSREAEYVPVERADEKTNIEVLELRTDAAVNHGNSGGGLFNQMGGLVGIVNARLEETGAAGVGYAIHGDFVRALVENMLDRGTGSAYVADPGFTVGAERGKSVFDEETNTIHIEEKTVVTSISAGAAFSSGLKTADTILAMSLERGGTEVCSAVITRAYMVDIFLLKARQGDDLLLTVSRGGETKTVKLGLKTLISFREYS